MFKKDVLIYFIVALIFSIIYIFTLLPVKYIQDNLYEFLSLIIGLNIPAFIMAIMNLIIEKQKSENNIKKLKIVNRVLNILLIIYLILYVIYIIFLIEFAAILKYG